MRNNSTRTQHRRDGIQKTQPLTPPSNMTREIPSQRVTNYARFERANFKVKVYIGRRACVSERIRDTVLYIPM